MSILFIYHGVLLPTNNGSRQRAYNLIQILNSLGHDVDLLLSEQVDSGYELTQEALKDLCREVYYCPRKNSKTFAKRLINSYHQWIREHSFSTFTDRIMKISTSHWYKEYLPELLKQNEYSHIVVSYTWLLDPILETIRNMQPNAQIVCDTCDLYWMRDNDSQQIRQHPFHNHKTTMRKELSLLKATDHILSISPGDHDQLEEFLPNNSIQLIPPALTIPLIKKIESTSPIFGFIGGKMKANLWSLDYILKEWWPLILERQPDAQLVIAGRICNSLNKYDLPKSVRLWNYIDEPEIFFKAINYLLNPVVVRGGINFKALEGILSGCHYITNTFGQYPFGEEIKLPFLINKPTDINNLLTLMEESPQSLQDQSNRLRSQLERILDLKEIRPRLENIFMPTDKERR